MFYLVKMPKWIKYIFPKMVWSFATNEKILYLTFDDGPHPIYTPFVLDLLKQYHAKATFFCIGKNVKAYPHLYQQIINEGHAVGNHTQHHVNGKFTNTNAYITDVVQGEKYISTNLFRPPYGSIKNSQINKVKALPNDYKIVMWSVLSADFDIAISKEKCFKNVISNATAGSIVVFHDSEKAAKNMQFALPKALEYFTEKNYSFCKISL